MFPAKRGYVKHELLLCKSTQLASLSHLKPADSEPDRSAPHSLQNALSMAYEVELHGSGSYRSDIDPPPGFVKQLPACLTYAQCLCLHLYYNSREPSVCVCMSVLS